MIALAACGCARATYDTRDDFTISTQVKIAILNDARVGALRLDAATTHGVVTLTGTVPSQADVDEALAVARRVRGVKGVKSKLTIATSLPTARDPGGRRAS